MALALVTRSLPPLRALALVACAALCACDDGRGFLELDLAGRLQKGPFQAATTGTLRGLSNELQPTGEFATARLGDIDTLSAQLRTAAPFVEITMQGRFLDETAGTMTAEPVALTALAPTRAAVLERRINVNVLTTLAAARARALRAAAAPAADPIDQAETELDRLFSFAAAAGSPRAFHRLDYTLAGPEHAFLLASSLVLLQAAREAGLSFATFLDRLAADFAPDGDVDDAQLLLAMSRAESTLDVPAARARLLAAYAAGGRSVALADTRGILDSAPLAAAGPDQVVTGGSIVVLDGSSSSDPDGDALSYGWTVVREQLDVPAGGANLPTRIELSGRQAQFTSAAAGSYAVTLTVTDPRGLAASDTLRVVARRSFVDHGDGTLSDTTSGLQWQQRSDGNAYTLAEATGRSFLGIPNETGGLNVCATLVLAGHDDWRVPGLDEMLTLRDYAAVAAPWIDSRAFPDTLAGPWLSNSWRPNSHADYVDFASSSVVHIDVRTRAPLRCVRP